MTEQIGKITLDLSKYPGEDFYCDGAVEDELLEIVQKYSEEEYGKVIEERQSWPVLYHLSHIRENIVDWIPMTKDMKVLEVGSGCGAITGALARKAGSVTCVDLSKKRSTINATRHKNCDNVTIHVGNFKDIEPDLATDFDMICLIGVFEYGQGYIGGKAPYEDFLRILQKHLKEDGRIIIAIENKYGLKYFAGCREDHSGTLFEGIENYNQGGGVRTFSCNGLKKIFKACGVEEYHFYYPYPDYKLPTTLYSEEYQPSKGELYNNMRNFDRDRMLLFDEKEAFDGIAEDDLFSVFSNSFLVVLGKDFPVKYVKYSNDRAPEYQIRTEIRKDADKWSVRKYPTSELAKGHVCNMEKAYRLLKERYKGSELELNHCVLAGESRELYAEFEFLKGITLSEIMDTYLEQGDLEGFYKEFQKYVKRIGYGEGSNVTDFDIIFGNILVDGDRWTLIDYEWTYEKDIPTKTLAYRTIHNYLLEDEKRKCLNMTRLMQELGISLEEADDVQKQEQEFQKTVDGEVMSMARMYAAFGKDVITPEEIACRSVDKINVSRVQIYKDLGAGYSEEDSYFLPDAYKDQQTIELEVCVDKNVKMLRIDPAMCSCICMIRELKWNGVEIPLKQRKAIIVNGQKIKTAEGMNIVFATDDPNINVNVERLQALDQNVLSARMEVVRISESVAMELMMSAKKFKYSLKGLFR